MGDVVAGSALGLGGDSALDFLRFAHPGLAEDGEQNDAAVGGEPVGDAVGLLVEVEPQLQHGPAQVPGQRLAKRLSGIGQAVGHSHHMTVVSIGQEIEPLPDLGLQLDLVPFTHRENSIPT